MVTIQLGGNIVSDITETITVDLANTKYVFEGWGTSLCWWANVLGKKDWSDEFRSDLLDEIFTLKSGGLGLNVARYNIGGGDNPTHNHTLYGRGMDGFLNEDGSYDWSKDESQISILKEAIRRGCNVIDAFSNSPPYFLTESGCSTGNIEGKSNLKEENCEIFADYLVRVVKYFKEVLCISFHSLEPFNEPSGTWWFAESTSEGCHLDNGTQQTLLRHVAMKLRDNRLAKILLSAPGECTIADTNHTFSEYSPDVRSVIGQLSTHSYYGGIKDSIQFQQNAKDYGLRPCVSEFGGGEGGHSHVSMDSALVLASAIHSDLRYIQPATWCMWQVCEDEAVQVKDDINWGPIHLYFDKRNTPDSQTDRYWLTKQFYAFANYTRFIRPGYSILECNSDSATVAHSSVDNKLVAVIVNPLCDYRNVKFFSWQPLYSNSKLSIYRTSRFESLVKLSNQISIDIDTEFKLIPHSVTTFEFDLF